MSATYEERLDAVIARADLGEPVDVQVDDGNWVTPFGIVSRTSVDDGNLMNVGPVILLRRTSQLQILGSFGGPPLPTKLRFDDQHRLYLTVTAPNGEWTWRLLQSSYVSDWDGYPVFIGRWPD